MSVAGGDLPGAAGGSAVIIHETDPTTTSRGAGGRIACGIIEQGNRAGGPRGSAPHRRPGVARGQSGR